jgi:hypothetical protein
MHPLCAHDNLLFSVSADPGVFLTVLRVQNYTVTPFFLWIWRTHTFLATPISGMNVVILRILRCVVVPDAPFITMKEISGSESVGRRPPETQRYSDVGVFCRSCRKQKTKKQNTKKNKANPKTKTK